MVGIDDIIAQGLAIINKVIPDPVAREQAKLNLLQAQQNGDLEEIRVALSAILEESKSADPWTSRARPSFMYVMYIMILAAIPMGVLYAIDPDVAKNIAAGTKAWLEAIPEELYALFGVGYLGYVKKRSDDKAVARGMPIKKTLGIF